MEIVMDFRYYILFLNLYIATMQAKDTSQDALTVVITPAIKKYLQLGSYVVEIEEFFQLTQENLYTLESKKILKSYCQTVTPPKGIIIGRYKNPKFTGKVMPGAQMEYCLLYMLEEAK